LESELLIRLVLVDPPAGIDFGIQSGRGAEYKSVLVQQRTHGDLVFDFALQIAESGKNGLPRFHGPYAQGPPASRFVYIDVGTYAGQQNTTWSRRMKVPLQGITWALIEKAVRKPGRRLSASIAGTGRDGGPNCATVQLLSDWHIIDGA
jgi:hypothetical protein